MAHRMIATRPMRDLLTRLPTLPVTMQQKVDYAAADPELLAALAEDAEILVRTMHHGVGALGQLLANSAVMVEDGTISADCLEAVGFLMAELGDMAQVCTTLAAQCRREVASGKPT